MIIVLAWVHDIVRASVLAASLYHSAPQYLTLETAAAHTRAAILAQNDWFSAEMLLAKAFLESNYQANAGPHERWPDPPRKPKYLYRHYICGFLQVTVKTWNDCLAMRDLDASYAEGVKQLMAWVDMCKQLGKKSRNSILKCAFAGYGPGTAAAKREDAGWYYAVRKRMILLTPAIVRPSS